MDCDFLEKVLVVISALLSVFPAVTGFAYFRDEIPNGKKVPHPCIPSLIWKGVGHRGMAGGGNRNQFGLDWYDNGKVWDETFCMMDSDGDGLTNGEELGDPNCEWTPGDSPHTVQGLSHPGICEPIDSEDCMDINSWWDEDCTLPEQPCDALYNDPDILNTTVAIENTNVPAYETTYMCQLVELPQDGDYHLVAVSPHIDNENVLHHIILYGCTDDKVAEVEHYATPTECGMEIFLCPNMVALWALGSVGTCWNSNYGTRIGTNGFKYALLEVHWNNPEERTDYFDASGLELYYTPNLREFDGSTLFIGPSYLELPPGYPVVKNEGHCPPECTRHMFAETVYFVEISPHMHYLGRGLKVELKKNGDTTVIMDDDTYDYDNPGTAFYDPPIEVQPGDEIIVTCTFNTVGQTSYTFFGYATAEEMCMATVMYYPQQANHTDCFVNEEVGYCGKFVGYDKVEDCILAEDELFAEEYWSFNETLYESCDPTGKECFENCSAAIQQVKEHVCFQSASLTYMKSVVVEEDELTVDFVQMMVSCDPKPDDIEDDNDDDVSSRAIKIQIQCLSVIGFIVWKLLTE